MFSCTQVPLEAILNYDSDSLHAIKVLIEQQQRSVTGRLASFDRQVNAPVDGDRPANANAGAKPATRSTAHSDEISSETVPVNHFAFHDEFDSSAETEREEGSQVTDMSESD